jgi:chorismate-pyruvate lyase
LTVSADRHGRLEALHDALCSADSATAVLEAFFGTITAERLDHPPSQNEGLRERLRLSTGERLRHRAVRLVAGEKILSQAELWYVADRLPADRLQLLETGNVPFGRIMQPVGLKRLVLMARICAPEEAASLVHRALLTTPAGVPVAEVYERYSWSLCESSS